MIHSKLDNNIIGNIELNDIVDHCILIIPNGQKELCYLDVNGIIHQTFPSDYYLFPAILYFFKDVYSNILNLGDFINYGIGNFPLSYNNEYYNSVIEFSQFQNKHDFEQRLIFLRKVYYDMMLKYVQDKNGKTIDTINIDYEIINMILNK